MTTENGLLPPPPAWAGAPAEVFDALRGETLALKSRGILGLPAAVSPGQARVLAENLGRLPVLSAPDGLGTASREILEDICRPWAEARAFPYWTQYAAMLGLSGRRDVAKARAASRHCVIAQALAMSPWVWPSPAQGLLYAGLQHALHQAFESYDDTEPFMTKDVIDKVNITFKHRIIDVLNRLGVSGLGMSKIKFASASMQGTHDRLGADLALVVGHRIHGKDVFRIVLIQAKKQDGDGRYPIRTAKSLRQLDRILSSGMGWYAFYPHLRNNLHFLVTVRPAADVFTDVWDETAERVAADDFASGGSGDAAWDLPTFVSLEMASPSLSLGRLFPDAAAVAEALSVERDVPLAEGVVMADLTGTLDLMAFKASLEAAGYKVEATASLDPAPRGAPRTRRRREGPSPSPKDRRR